LGSSNAAGGGYDYNTDNGGIGAGSDWASITYDDGTVNERAETNQSPIGLFSKG